MAAPSPQSHHHALQRPLLTQLWTLFQDVAPVSQEPYPVGTIKNLTRIGDKIGGAVKKNFDLGIADIQSSPGAYPVHPLGFTNGCATRMSYILNYSGVSIPRLPDGTITGADHKNYIFRVADIKAFLPQRFGAPDIAKDSTAGAADFAGRKGIIAFDVQFTDASGHVTLWDGKQAVDEDYFDAASRHGAKLSGVSLWLCP